MRLLAAVGLAGLLAAGLWTTAATRGVPTGDGVVARAGADGQGVRSLAGPANPTRHRGVSWVASRDTVRTEDMDRLASLGVNWIVQTPFGWQRAVDEPSLRLARGDRVWWGERDEGIRRTTLAARARGIETLLKPHIWLSDRNPNTWRGQIAMTSPEDWDAWFADYERFILHYARLAQDLGIPALCIGTELHGTIGQEDAWRALIARVREVYDGRLTYAANWHDEYQEVPFWDALDWIGIQAYFPVAASDHASAQEMRKGWGPWLEAIEQLQARVERPVLFTEVGYRSFPGAAREPWAWPQRGERTEDPRDFTLQADAYSAMFDMLWDRPWFQGIYVWKWYATRTLERRDYSADFTPQGKPAEDVIRRAFLEASEQG